MKVKPWHVLAGAGALYLGYRAFKKRSASSGDDTLLVVAGPRTFPNVVRDGPLIEAKAREIWSGRRDTGPDAVFDATRQTMLELWPNLPWPQTTADQQPVLSTGTQNVYLQKWVNDAGAAGNAMKAAWDHANRLLLLLAGPSMGTHPES